MKRIFKLICIFFIVSILTITLCACSSNGDGNCNIEDITKGECD